VTRCEPETEEWLRSGRVFSAPAVLEKKFNFLDFARRFRILVYGYRLRDP
jgi:hypothetical protein